MDFKSLLEVFRSRQLKQVKDDEARKMGALLVDDRAAAMPHEPPGSPAVLSSASLDGAAT